MADKDTINITGLRRPFDGVRTLAGIRERNKSRLQVWPEPLHAAATVGDVEYLLSIIDNDSQTETS